MEYNGVFYGTASDVWTLPATFSGILFKWNPATDEYTLLHNFKSDTGHAPNTVLVVKNNKLYGTTRAGGLNDQGVIFEYDLGTNVYTKRADLANLVSNREVNATAGLTLMNGKIYGVAVADNASLPDALYEWDPDNYQFTTVKDVNGVSQGPGPYVPVASLVAFQNKLYGVSKSGGSNAGEIVEWDPAAGTYISKATFTASTGTVPLGRLVAKDSKFYGVTSVGGASSGGTIYEWDPGTGIITSKADLPAPGSIKANPVTPVLVGDKFFGIAGGGEFGKGLVYEWDPATNAFDIRYSFASNGSGIFQEQLLLRDGKLFGSREIGNAPSWHDVFEWDPVTYAYTSKYATNVADAVNAWGTVMPLDGKIYGTTQAGGTYGAGVLFEFDPVTKSYKRMQNLNASTGATPTGNLALLNGKLYGVTNNGGANGYGAFFEWDYRTNVLTKKRDFNSVDGRSVSGDLVEKDGKFYGMTRLGGTNNYGVIFEWEPVTDQYTVKWNFDLPTGRWPLGGLCLKDGKFYGFTFDGGVYYTGVVFEWDPVTNVYTKLRDLRNSTGNKPRGNFIVYGDKLYGVAESEGAGVMPTLLEVDPKTKDVQVVGNLQYLPIGNIWVIKDKFYYIRSHVDHAIVAFDPQTKVSTVKGVLSEETGYSVTSRTMLNQAPAPVSAGSPGKCLTLPNSTIDAGNANQWLPITDAAGNAVAEVKANGNNLGNVRSWLYVHGGAVRKDRNGRYFLGRDFTMTPASVPGSKVDVRIYVKQDQYDALVAANNADPQADPITTVQQVGVFQTNFTSCSGGISGSPRALLTAVEPWSGGGYVFKFSADSFTTFYIGNNIGALPVKLVDFTARLRENVAMLTWQTAEEVNFSHFELQRSANGRDFQTIGIVSPSTSARPGFYEFADTHLHEIAASNAYYRLKMIDKAADGQDGAFAYSAIVQVAVPEVAALLYPNPVQDVVSVNLPAKTPASWEMVNAEGITLRSGQSRDGKLQLNVRDMAHGIYFLRVFSGQAVHIFKFVK